MIVDTPHWRHTVLSDEHVYGNKFVSTTDDDIHHNVVMHDMFFQFSWLEKGKLYIFGAEKEQMVLWQWQTQWMAMASVQSEQFHNTIYVLEQKYGGAAMAWQCARRSSDLPMNPTLTVTEEDSDEMHDSSERGGDDHLTATLWGKVGEAWLE